MRIIIVGLGVQGHKRRLVAGDEAVLTVDPYNQEADFSSIEEVPLDAYNAALLCIPDEPKVEIIGWLVDQGKHVLVEKPLFAPDESVLADLEGRARASESVIYTAYNHRFEPHFAKLKEIIASGRLGRIYRCRMFYGNGTARLVRESAWRDTGSGVLPDLGSHLLDTALFWFDEVSDDLTVFSANQFENRAPDHVVFGSEASEPRLEFEATLLMWRNHFTCDLLAEKGSAHITSLCKWGPSSLYLRTRILPSGMPPEEVFTLVQPDPTWAIEYDHFKALIRGGANTDLSRDRWLNRTLRKLGTEAVRMAGTA